MPLHTAFVGLILLAGTPVTANVAKPAPAVKPAAVAAAPQPAAAGAAKPVPVATPPATATSTGATSAEVAPCTPMVVDTMKEQAAEIVTGKFTAAKDDGLGARLITLKVLKSWKGAAVGTDLVVRQDPDMAATAEVKPVDFKAGKTYFVVAYPPAPGQKVPLLVEGCGSSGPEADAQIVLWELDNGPIEQAPRIAVLDLLKNPDKDVRLRVINRLDDFKDNDAEVYSEVKEHATKDPETTVRVAAAHLMMQGGLAGKVEFKTMIALLAGNDPDVGPEACHTVVENAKGKSAFRKKAISALQKLIVNRKDKAKAKKKTAPVKWDAKQALACIEGREPGDKSPEKGDYGDAWGK